MSKKLLNIYNSESGAAKRRLTMVMSSVSVVLLLYFGLNLKGEITPSLATKELIVGALLAVNLAYFLLHQHRYNFSSGVLLGLLAYIFMSIYIDGGISLTGNLWLMIFPLMVYYLHGERLGNLWLIIYFTAFIAISIGMILGQLENPYDPLYIRQTLIVLIVISIFSYSNERIKSLALEKLEASQQELAKVFENMQDIYYRIDLNGTITELSSAALTIFGYRPEEIIGTQTYHYYKTLEERDEILNALAEHQGRLTNYKTKMLSKSGEDLYMLVNAQYFYDEHGEVQGIEGTIKDITDLQHAEEELRELNKHLEVRISQEVEKLRERDLLMLQQARLAQMGEMLAMIAHQWRQPLSSISAITGNLKFSLTLGDSIDPKELSRSLDKIDNHTLLLSQTIDDFRNFFRSNKSRNDIKSSYLIDRVLDVLEPLIQKKNITLKVAYNRDGSYKGFESELIQVIMNLIKNAVDAMEGKEDKIIWIRVDEDKKDHIISIEDNGGGIPEDILSDIFNPYFSTKSDKNGTGLGLYMSRLIIHDHSGGTLSVENTKEGARFTIRLPKEKN